MPTSRWDLIVIGAGIVGAMHAWKAADRGRRVLILERHSQPRGATLQNFGMIIPSGMPPGDWHRRAVRSAAFYRSQADRWQVPQDNRGTIYLA